MYSKVKQTVIYIQNLSTAKNRAHQIKQGEGGFQISHKRDTFAK